MGRLPCCSCLSPVRPLTLTVEDKDTFSCFIIFTKF